MLELSEKQAKVMFWWIKNRNHDAIICDGAIRSGKTFCLSASFVFWSFYEFNNNSFGICGKTITSLKRNLIFPMLNFIEIFGFKFKESIRENKLTIFFGNQQNDFYLFGGKDRSSFTLIQGATFSGILFDEIVLMPESFVKQALARCSIKNSKFFFNCNPDSKTHWFYREWISNFKSKNTIYIHFDMKDNPTLNSKIINRYNNLYTGSFFTRYILGRWKEQDGLVYPFMSNYSFYCDIPCKKFIKYVISCDYGIIHPFSCGLWGFDGNVWFRIEEYYYDSKLSGITKTDEEYYEDIRSLIFDYVIDFFVIDPSASSFISLLKQKGGIRIRLAKNNISEGINLTSNMLKNGRIKICKNCINSIREFSIYKWKQNSYKIDTPEKENDHAMDDIRYFVMSVFNKKESGCFVYTVNRNL
ncbi:MAG: PBSX family phage terminase large subunit [Candidatus Improbicoccus pseudotrichonymphae]|uniref:PBSX family phage terminase large subunit n=1 Tax=Candidatus Improbicoccus pseudotrichonymphae TaxID=3033792 RepID=A0AA48HVF2_9FIRM|nr:MAG: PBSX family phage terminase large subunit [Candidatus Improbicoccus pseudotrichonymphae]